MGRKIIEFDDFFNQALDNLAQDPFKTKVIVKYTHNKKLVNIRVTDGRKTLITKLKAKEDFEKLEKFIHVVTKILSNNLEDDQPVK
jgi:predicted DNA binding CopG/RHH family protein